MTNFLVACGTKTLDLKSERQCVVLSQFLFVYVLSSPLIRTA